MRTYIHDPEFEVDYMYSDEEIFDSSLSDKLYELSEMFRYFQEKKIEDYQSDETSDFLRDLKDFLDRAEDEIEYSNFYKEDENMVFYRESIYLLFKSLLLDGCLEYLKTHQSFAQLCKSRAVEILDSIGDVEDDMWKNTRIAVVDFLSADLIQNL